MKLLNVKLLNVNFKSTFSGKSSRVTAHRYARLSAGLGKVSPIDFGVLSKFGSAMAAGLLASALLIVHLAFSPSWAQTLANSANYSAGLSSYINGDFESAKQQWLLAAQANDGKAMFNLGLMHERQQVAGADSQRAEQWFRQAGNAGYGPADYHLGLLLQSQGRNSEGNRLLRRAADSGFILAQEHLGIEPDSAPVASSPATSVTQPVPSVVEPVISQNSPVGSVDSPTSYELSNRVYNRESWLLRQPSESWTIQMLAFSDEAKVRNFIDDHGLHRNAAYFAQATGGKIVYKLVYGSYATKARADEARTKFTSSLKEHGPWLRQIKAVQKIIEQR